MKAIEKEGDKILATLRDERMKALKMEQERDEFRLKSRKMEKKLELAEESLLKQEKDSNSVVSSQLKAKLITIICYICSKSSSNMRVFFAKTAFSS